MTYLIGLIVISGIFIIWGYFLLEHAWKYTDDLDTIFFVSIIPVAIALWAALYLAGA